MTKEERIKLLDKDIKRVKADREVALFNHQYEQASILKSREKELLAEKERLKNN
jgi:hypothetical protein